MKSKSALILIVTIVIIALTGAIAYNGIGEDNLLGMQQIKKGLDLAGGVSITYEADKEKPTETEMKTALSLIQKRLDFNNYTEAQAVIEGEKRIHVEIPGVKDPQEAIKKIGQTARLRFIGIDESKLKLDKDKQLTADEYIKTVLEQNAYEEVVSGSDIANATKQYGSLTRGGQAEAYVKLELTSEGKDKFAKATKKYMHKIIPILLDDKQISMPTVSSEITDGVAIITGMRDVDEADNLASLIRAGALPFNLITLEDNIVGAQLGADALSSSLLAGIIGAVLVLAFMLIYYKVPGLAADIALLFYGGLVIILISAFKITLTLPGIAGIILTIGMAVDANIIIFSRIREEFATGKGLNASVKAGFSKALSAIIDGNVTTLIAAAVLWKFGTGPIKGFAQTFALGVIVSMFTALFITRLVLKQFMALGIRNPKLYGAK